jgi:hypothetical protein
MGSNLASKVSKKINRLAENGTFDLTVKNGIRIFEFHW